MSGRYVPPGGRGYGAAAGGLGPVPDWLVVARVVVWLLALGAALFWVTTAPAAVLAQLVYLGRALVCTAIGLGADRLLSAAR